MKILLIDNFDSFTFNIYQYLKEMGVEVVCFRNNEVSCEKIKKLQIDSIFISPGPGRPIDAGNCIDIVKTFAGQIPIFGICLGLQIIGEAFGGKIIKASQLVHGKVSKITSLKKGVLHTLPSEFQATRYHSLIVDRQTLPTCFEVTCENDSKEIMGLKHKVYNIEGVQFHPESIMTKHGKRMIQNFLERIRQTPDKLNVPKIDFDKTSFSKTVYTFSDKKFQVLRVSQKSEKLSISKPFFKLFESIQSAFGKNKSCILDSVKGPKVDCNGSYIGLFPEFEILIKNRKMFIETENHEVIDIFINNFHSIYHKEEDCFYLDNLKFSDIFPIITATFSVERDTDSDIDFSVGLIGFFSYEYLYYLENVKRTKSNVLDMPDVHLIFYSTIIQMQEKGNEVTIVLNNLSGAPHREISILHSILESSIDAGESKSESHITAQKHSNVTKQSFCQKVRKAKHYIEEGDIFQVQIGRRITLNEKIDPLSIYKKLRLLNPSPYMFFWGCKNYQLISNSPELQLKVQNGDVLIRPIAGTSQGKGKTKEEAEALMRELANSEKERAEHIMLVDLARNDIGRVAIPGTVRVSQLMEVEEFSHVFHLVSSVEAKISDEVSSMKLFESTFPAGTLTGAPKVRAMEIISELEEEERGPYGGVFGFFEFNGNILSTIIIRTILYKNEMIYLQSAAGIVADSTEEREWNELQHKTEAIEEVLF